MMREDVIRTLKRGKHLILQEGGLILITKGTARFIGRKVGQGQRGPWYQVSIVTDGEPVTLRCTPNVYDQCGSCDFGEEIDFLLESRLFDRQWVLSISSLGE